MWFYFHDFDTKDKILNKKKPQLLTFNSAKNKTYFRKMSFLRKKKTHFHLGLIYILYEYEPKINYHFMC